MVLIIGKRANLSKSLSKYLPNSVLISSSEIETELFDILDNAQENVKVIFNNFQASFLLNEYCNMENYINNSIVSTVKVLSILEKSKVIIDKIIYTSSSSVYGNNKFCSEIDPVKPMNLQASLKIANEELIKRFCEYRKIDYTITRIFNMYGGDDRFSIISKIKDAYVSNKSINIINEGNSIRDYVYIDDVVNVYLKLLKVKKLPKKLNIATGKGKRVSDILNFLKLNELKIKTVNITKDELYASIADTNLLNKIIDTSTFTDINDFLIKDLSQCRRI